MSHYIRFECTGCDEGCSDCTPIPEAVDEEPTEEIGLYCSGCERSFPSRAALTLDHGCAA